MTKRGDKASPQTPIYKWVGKEPQEPKYLCIAGICVRGKQKEAMRLPEDLRTGKP